MQITEDRTREGLERLLLAPRDLDRWDRAIGEPGKQRASVEHRRLFEQYKREFAEVAAEAERQWDAEIAWLREHSENSAEAIRERWTMIPAGPAARPFLVAFVRRMWLSVDSINRLVPEHEAVAPEVFLVKWLMEEVPLRHVCMKVLAVIPYWPMGLDMEGNWI
jgi:hypothetical protein